VSLLFDPKLRAMRRDRAARQGVELFLYERAFTDCLERLELVQRRFGKALLIGCPDASWPQRLKRIASELRIIDPGPILAELADGDAVVEDEWVPDGAAYDLVVAVGTLDTVNDVPRALTSICRSMCPDALLIGAVSGGDTLPQLRAAMRAADHVTGGARPHVHPRIEASALAPLLSAAGFQMPVVDVDRVQVAYRSFDRLVGDLRAMGATNLLMDRGRRPLGRAARRAATASFTAAGDGARTLETFEILHFAAWTPAGIDPQHHQ
jgi:hypothetical protein